MDGPHVQALYHSRAPSDHLIASAVIFQVRVCNAFQHTQASCHEVVRVLGMTANSAGAPIDKIAKK